MAKKKNPKRVAAAKKAARTRRRNKEKQQQHDPLYQLPPNLSELHRKKLEIMSDIPVVPCSALGKDNQGHMYAYTRAEKIFRAYHEKAVEKKLVFRMIACEITTGKYAENWKYHVTETPCTIANCTFEVTDTESNQKETFKGCGMGDNGVWSAQSAQTVAFKQGLIMYFLNAWPQADDFSEIIKKELEPLPFEDLVKVMKCILPSKTHEVLTSRTAVKELTDFFGQSFKEAAKKTTKKK